MLDSDLASLYGVETKQFNRKLYTFRNRRGRLTATLARVAMAASNGFPHITDATRKATSPNGSGSVSRSQMRRSSSGKRVAARATR
jgi:hypothetical protein